MYNSLKKIYSLFPRKDRIKFGLLLCLMLVTSLFEVVGIGLIPIFVKSVLEYEYFLQLDYLGDILRATGIDTRESIVLYGAILLIVVFTLKNLYLVYFSYIKNKFLANRRIYLQNRLFKAYMTAPYSYYLNRNSAQLLRNVTGEVGKILSGTIMPFLEISLKVTMFIMIVSLLYFWEPLVTVFAVVILGGGGFIFLRLTQKRMEQSGKDDRDARGELNKVVLQGLGGFKDARVMNREKMFLRDYDYHAQITKKTAIYRSVINSLPRPIVEMLLVIGILSITVLTVMQGDEPQAIILTLVLFGVAAIKLMPIFNSVISQINSMQYSAYSVFAIYDDLIHLEKEYEEYRKFILKDTERLELRSSIELKSISYSYPESEEQAVRDVSLSIPKGAAVAFVGPSGAGKTTLVDIILGLLHPNSGTIEVDGVDVYDNIRGWMMNIGYIPQSIFLLDDRIRRNIAFGIPDNEVDDEKLRKALEAAQLDELVARLPKKEMTKVGERGVKLSGGQQQRIGIARALYNNPQVLLMDEATSALDNITEKYVIEAIERLRGDRTIIMIAHRLTTVMNCDTIYMMREGKIVGHGTYNELLENNAEFRKMSLIEE